MKMLANRRSSRCETEHDFGLGFTLGRGYSLVWSGWDAGAPRANNGMAARFPTATENGKPVVGRIRDEFHIGTRAPGKGDVVRLHYPAASTDTESARLAFRDREDGARTEIPSSGWEFVDNQTIRLLTLGTNFAPFKIYEIWYEATGSTVSGIGFAATPVGAHPPLRGPVLSRIGTHMVCSLAASRLSVRFSRASSRRYGRIGSEIKMP
jgi:hypothetical protein